MKRFAKQILLTLTLAVTFSIAKAQKVDISEVTTIDVNIACQLVMVQGDSPNLEIIGEEKAVANVKTQIRNGKLILSHKKEFSRMRKEDVVVKIEVADLSRLNISGVVDMKTVRTLHFNNFHLAVSGVGNIDMNLFAEDFKLTCSGVATINLTGQANDMRVNVSGVGNVSATDFEAKNAVVSNSGVGRVQVFAHNNLDASVSGIGSIRYAGNPSVRSDVSGLGRISRK